VFEILSKYLHQYQQLYIPYIGTFEVVEQSARLEIADRLLYPPVFEIRYSEEGSVKDSQLEYLQEEWGTDLATVEKRLQQFGRKLKERLTGGPFNWQGIGLLSYRQNNVEFQGTPLTDLTPVEAHKVIRENVQHTVLIGEQEIQSGDVAGYIQDTSRKRSLLVIIGWIILALAILFIIYYFYKEGFKPESSGSRVKAVSALAVQSLWFH
jgi:hypothetical protein